MQLLKVLRTEWLISGFVLSSLDRFRVLADSLIFRDKPWELDRNNSRPKQDILNYAVYNNGSAQARVFETTSIPNESVFYFVNKCRTDPDARTEHWLQQHDFFEDFSPPFNVPSCALRHQRTPGPGPGHVGRGVHPCPLSVTPSLHTGSRGRALTVSVKG